MYSHTPQDADGECFSGNLDRTHKRECLNYFMCFDLDQLDYITKTWVMHYNLERPHRGSGMGDRVLDETFEPQPHGTVRSKQQLGGLTKSHYREAA